jgi:GMP reductase
MHLENDVKLDYKDVLIRPKRSRLTSRKNVSLERNYNWVGAKGARINEYDYTGVPIMAANMDGVGTFDTARALAKQGMFTCLVKTYSIEELQQFFSVPQPHVAMSIGIGDADLNKLEQVHKAVLDNLQYICVDVANGYTERFVEFIKHLRDTYPFKNIIAGNVVTADQTQELILNGADIIKVGIGPGSVCTTRIQTGVGYPQLSAVMECADAAHGLGGHIIADGGCTTPGDVAKAFAAGADFVMLGGMLAGHDEGGGESVYKFVHNNEYFFVKDDESYKPIIDRKEFRQFYGMSSQTANKKHFGGLKDYRSSEGRTILVPYRGPIENTVQDILGGIRSTCTYVGAPSLKQLSKCTTFVRCTQTHNAVYEKNTIGN